MINPFVKTIHIGGLDEFIDKLYNEMERAIRKAEMICIGGSEINEALASMINKSIELEIRPDMKYEQRIIELVGYSMADNKLRGRYKGNNPEFTNKKAIFKQFNGSVTKNTITDLIHVGFMYTATDVYNCGGTKEMINILNIDKPSKVEEKTMISMIIPKSTRLLTDLEFLIKNYCTVSTTSIVQNRFKTYTLETVVKEQFTDGLRGNYFNICMEYMYRHNWQDILKELRKVSREVSHKDYVNNIDVELTVTKRQKGE